MEAIMHTLKQYSEEPQTSAAAIAAIYRMSRNASGILKKLSFDEQMVTLAALQHVDANKLDLSARPGEALSVCHQRSARLPRAIAECGRVQNPRAVALSTLAPLNRDPTVAWNTLALHRYSESRHE
jgi:hypothetical protein